MNSTTGVSGTDIFDDAFGRLSASRVLVLGDLISDHYVRGAVERTSPEAPVPVVLWQGEQIIPGGAANVARNIRDAGALVDCVGVTGDDADAARLLAAMQAAGISAEGIVRVAGRPTTVKTRIVAQNQQMLRLDRECCDPLPPEAIARLLSAFRERLASAGAVILSDYAKGTLPPHLISVMIKESAGAGVPLFVDPKGRDYARYRGAYCLTPNAREAAEASGLPVSALAGPAAGTALAQAAAAIFAQCGCRMLAITRGAEGLALFEARELQEPEHPPLLMPTLAREVFDVTGAGDTFVGFLALATAAGYNHSQAAHIANAAAGIVVGKVGAGTVSPAELRVALSPDGGRLSRKLRAPEDLAAMGRDLRAAGKRIVFTNGCFDFLHAGHVTLLHEARTLGDVLIVATNTDDAIARLKGPPRPVIRQRERERLLAALEAVDYVVPFPADTPHALLRDLLPDILVKGANYDLGEVEGRDVVESHGGKVVLLGALKDISTRDMLAMRPPARTA